MERTHTSASCKHSPCLVLPLLFSQYWHVPIWESQWWKVQSEYFYMKHLGVKSTSISLRIELIIFLSTQRYRIFFLPWKRLCPLTHSNLENSVFFSEGCIFFSESIFELFSPKMSKLVKIPTSTQNSGAGKKNTARKKKYTIFTHSLDFERKWHESNLFQEKKYGTFGSTSKLIFLGIVSMRKSSF